MCGIAGLIDASRTTEERAEIVGRMCAAMVHRGPDDQGIESRDGATLGARRLAIFDPANGHQPMVSQDGRFTIAFNGAIYNFRELRTELASGGWVFRTQCDTEVLLAACARWGLEGVNRLRGMYAFALWDSQERALHLARDPFGIKPLYYWHDSAKLVFGSEINALRGSGVFASEIDPVSVSDYLAWLAVPSPRTIFRDIFSLRPGESATYRDGRLEIRTAWKFSSIPESAQRCRSRKEFIAELRARLDDTARAHVLADVPVGAFLSGGLDSAVVAGLMSRASGAQLRTFSLGFAEPGYSEAAEAEATARHLGARHETRILAGAEVAADLPNFLAACDQPTGDGLNTYYASQLAHAGGVKVALSGLGGDELFGGYPSFRQVPKIAAWLPRWRLLPGKIQRLILEKLRNGDTRRRKLADFLQYTTSAAEVNAMQRRVFSEQGRRAMLGREIARLAADRSPLHPEFLALRSELADLGPLEMISGWELRTYMPDVLLRDSDVMSMRHALELRVPFIDRPLIEWLWRQPAEFKFTPAQPKSALAEAAADLLPPGMAQRRKQGFTLPMALWMRRELKPFLDETFSTPSLSRTGFFNRLPVQAAWNRFHSGDDHSDWSRIWSLAVLIAFVNRSSAPSGSPAPSRSRLEVAGRPEILTSNPLQRIAAERLPSPAPQSPSPALHAARRELTLLMVPEIFASVGGISRMIQLYLKALCDLGAERNRGVRLLALNDDALDSRDTRRYSGSALNDWYVCNGKKPRFVKEAMRMSKGCDQVICGHVAQLPVAWGIQKLHPKLKYYLVAHGIEVWRKFTFLERLALRGAERIFCVSDFTRQELQKHCRLRPGRAVVLPNAIDASAFTIESGRPLAECPPTILTVSRLSYADRYKGVEHLIGAMPAIRAAEPQAELRIIGRGDDLPRLQSLARAQGLLNTGITFLGPVDDKTVAKEMRACRLFALPSGREGFGIVYLEAMACGRPCVGAKAGGVPEVITEETGILVEVANVPAIAKACVAALKWKWREEAIINQARKFSFEAFKQRLSNELYI